MREERHKVVALWSSHIAPRFVGDLARCKVNGNAAVVIELAGNAPDHHSRALGQEGLWAIRCVGHAAARADNAVVGLAGRCHVDGELAICRRHGSQRQAVLLVVDSEGIHGERKERKGRKNWFVSNRLGIPASKKVKADTSIFSV